MSDEKQPDYKQVSVASLQETADWFKKRRRGKAAAEEIENAIGELNFLRARLYNPPKPIGDALDMPTAPVRPQDCDHNQGRMSFWLVNRQETPKQKLLLIRASCATCGEAFAFQGMSILDNGVTDRPGVNADGYEVRLPMACWEWTEEGDEDGEGQGPRGVDTTAERGGRLEIDDGPQPPMARMNIPKRDKGRSRRVGR